MFLCWNLNACETHQCVTDSPCLMTIHISIMSLTIGQIVDQVATSRSSEISSQLLSPRASIKMMISLFFIFISMLFQCIYCYFNGCCDIFVKGTITILSGSWSKIWNISVTIILFTLKVNLISMVNYIG